MVYITLPTNFLSATLTMVMTFDFFVRI